MSLRVTRQLAEILATGAGNLRVTRQHVEVLTVGVVIHTPSLSSVISFAHDAFGTITGSLRVSKQHVEVLGQGDGNLRVSRQHVEVLAQGTVIFTPSLSSVISFSHDVSNVYEADVTDLVTFTQSLTWAGPHYRNILANLNLSQTVNAYKGTPWDAAVFESVIAFTQRPNITQDGTANNVLSLTDEAYRSQTPASTLGITDSVANGKSKPIDESDLNLSQSIALSNDFVRVMSNENFIGHSLTYYVESGCNVKQYTPFVGENTIPDSPSPPETTEPIVQADPTTTRFQLSYPALATPTDTVILRAPELDNIDRLAFTRISRETRGGKLLVFADPAWPQTETVIVTFIGLTRAEVESLQTFFVAHIGEEIGMQDWEGREWVGIVTTPNESAVNDGGRDACDGKGWTITFEFEGVLVDGHAPNNLMSFSQTINTVLVSPP